MRASSILAASLAATLLATAQLRATAAPQAPQTTQAASLARSSGNLLSNPGFQSWSFGYVPDGFISPDDWWSQGEPSNQFESNGVVYRRVDADPACPGGDQALRFQASMPGDFVAQNLANFAEFRDCWVTFALDIRPFFDTATPAISIDDGVTSSTYSELIHQADGWQRFVVSHRVSACATRLQFRVLGQQTQDIDNATARLGRYAGLPKDPVGNPQAAWQQLPLGTVIDWYRMDSAVPVPDGFVICDGSAVNDAASAFLGSDTPNLVDRFVLGVGSESQIGSTGGAQSHDLNHNHKHDHTHSGTTGGPSQNWLILQFPVPPVIHAGSNNHTHSFTTGGPSNNWTDHRLGTIDNRPPYVGLLKIMRVR